MNKKLPSIFANKIDKKIENNNRVSVTKNDNREEVLVETKEVKNDFKSINQKINEIFSSPKYVYKASVTITLKDKVITKKIIGKNNKNIITMDNELIPIEDILDIEFTK